MDKPGPNSALLRQFALVLGPAPLAATLLIEPPSGLTQDAWYAAGLALFMAIWWLTEAMPLAVTALLPVAVWPAVSSEGIKAVATDYANPLIFLFLGGFLLAKAIESSGLHIRIAQTTLRLAGTRPHHVLAAIMLPTAFLSLWISNTASAMVMAPLAAAVALGARDENAAALMLGVAYAATIGGMGSLIGTPPNAIFAAFVADTYGRTVGFVEWMVVGLPVALALLGVTWGLLAFQMRTAGANIAPAAGAPEQPVSQAQRRVALIAGATALCWIFRPWLDAWTPGIAISDAGIAITAAVLLFALPDGGGRRLLDWETAASIRWDVLILVGGGLALARILDASGLAAAGGQAASALQAIPVPLLIVLASVFIVLLGELASNTAMAAVFLPVAGASAAAMEVDPLIFTAPVALAASIGFMLPVATPPNAIVFTHPEVTRSRMLRAGAPLDLAGALIAAGIGAPLAALIL